MFFALFLLSAGTALASSSEWEKFRSSPPVKRVQELYRQESARIGKVDPDPKLTQARLTQAASDLKPTEIAWLQREALNPKASSDGRLFATYLIALANKPDAMRALGEIAASPFEAADPETDSKKGPKKKGPSTVEGSLRAQAVEGLRRACKKIPAARDGLLEVVARQEDESLRELAHRGLYECEARKPAKAEDRQALEKALYGK